MISSSIIQGYYHTILNRAGSDAEVAGWTNLVADGTLPISQVEVGFINSFETQTSVVPIIEIYQAALGRVPDRASLMAWVSALNSGAATMQQISLSIAGSAESQALYGTTFDANFITTVYENILGREPEGGAVDGWLAAKDAGLNQAMMIDAIATSVEAKMRYAPAVPNFLRSAVQNNPDAYEGSLFRSGLSFALTTNVDSGVAFTGSTGNDTFQAVEITVGSPVPTWTTADAIDGGGGNDTFNVTQTAPIIGAPLNATVANIETANIVDAGAVTLDTTLWTGLMELNVTDSGATTLTADVPTSVGVTDTAGAVSITGGWNQAVMTSAGDVTLAHGSGTLSVDDSALGLHTVNVNGGSSVDIAVTGETTGSGNVINVGSSVAPTGAVTIIASSDPLATTGGTMGSIFVKGGSSINITQNALGAPSGFTTAAGYVGISGTADTKSVTVAQSARVIASVGVRGVGNNSVGISDVNQASNTLAGTITSVTASNFTTLNISDNALTTLAVAGGSGNVLVSNGNLTIPTNLTLNATIDGETGGSFIDSNVYTRLNITTANSNSTLANISFAATTTLAIAGTKALRLTSTNGLAALQTVTVSGAAGLTANLSGAQVTAIDTSATTGTSTIFMDGSRATFSGGNGADIVTVSSQASKAIALGGGDDEIIIGSFVPTATISGGLGIDTLSIDSTAAATASGNNIFAGWVTGFEQLILTGATNQTIDLAVLGILGGVTTHGGNGMTLSNMSSGSTLTLDGAGTAYTISNAAFTAGVSDVINLALTDGSGAGVAFATTGITAANVETIAITTADTQATPSGTFNDLITLLGNSSSTITVAGNAGLTLNATSTRLTTVNAGGISLGGFSWTSGALTAAASITGSASGTNTVDFSAANGGVVTYTGGSGTDNVSANNNKNNVINLGDGNNNLAANGTGDQTITGGAGSNNITVGNGNNTITTGSGSATITVGSGSNTITLGSHTALTADDVHAAATTTGTYIPTATITGMNSAGLDTIKFTGDLLANSFTFFSAQQLVTLGASVGNAVNGAGPATLADAVADVLSNLGAGLARHGVGAFQFAGATYLVEQAAVAGTAFGTGDTLVKLTGTPTINTTSISGGVLHLLT